MKQSKDNWKKSLLEKIEKMKKTIEEPKDLEENESVSLTKEDSAYNKALNDIKKIIK